MPDKNPVLMLVLTLGLLGALILGGCGGQPAQTGNNFDSAYQKAVKPYRFNYAAWEAETFGSMLKQKLSGPALESSDETQFVVNYFKTIAQLEQIDNRLAQVRAKNQTGGPSDLEIQRAALALSLKKDKAPVENILARQISLTLAESGIYNPGANNWLKITFPPVSFQLEPSLNLLMVSPRDIIESLRQTVIKPDISAAQSDQLEAAIDRNNVSSLVIPLGGLGATYPSFVIESSDLKFSLDVIAEEWFHQYMAFRPLGFRYVLQLTGTGHNPDIAALNETAVGIASQEIGNLVYQRYYAAYYPADNDTLNPPQPAEFDFNAAMRQTRLNVDAFLAAGQVEQAESYMEEQRQMLVNHGYYIRKLNQAYFAFYGSYAYSGTSVDPIGDQVRQLRSRSASLQDFVQIVSGLTSRGALLKALARN